MSLKESIRLIYLADDHQIVAEGIGSLLKQISPEIKVQIFLNGRDLFEACALVKPDLIFLDIEMPIWDGRVTLKNLKINYPELKILILSMLDEKHMIEDMIQKGASGFINKNCSVTEMEEALSAVAGGEIYYSRAILQSLAGVKKVNSVPILSEPLSERELEILQWLCEGLSPKEIGDKIHLSHRTVETHKTNIMRKMNVNSVAKLISSAVKMKLV